MHWVSQVPETKNKHRLRKAGPSQHPTFLSFFLRCACIPFRFGADGAAPLGQFEGRHDALLVLTLRACAKPFTWNTRCRENDELCVSISPRYQCMYDIFLLFFVSYDITRQGRPPKNIPNTQMQCLGFMIRTDNRQEHHTSTAVSWVFSWKARPQSGRELQQHVAGESCRNRLLLVPCLLYTSPSPRDRTRSRMPSSA